MDPLSFLVLRRIASKIANGIDIVIDVWHHLTFNQTPKEMAEKFTRPGAPGYLPRKKRDEL